MANGQFSNKARARAKMRLLGPAMRASAHAVQLKNANEFIDAARRVAPEISGDLKRSHHVEDRSTIDEVAVRAIAGDEKAFYARWVEFITSPWFYPTYRSLKRRFKSRATREAGKAARAAVKKVT